MLSALIGSCIKYHEQHGYFRFYTVYTANKLKAYKRLWDERATVSKYTSFTEVEVGANEKVKQAEFWEKLYGRLLLPEPSIVRGFIRPMGDAVIRI